MRKILNIVMIVSLVISMIWSVVLVYQGRWSVLMYAGVFQLLLVRRVLRS